MNFEVLDGLLYSLQKDVLTEAVKVNHIDLFKALTMRSGRVFVSALEEIIIKKQNE